MKLAIPMRRCRPATFALLCGLYVHFISPAAAEDASDEETIAVDEAVEVIGRTPVSPRPTADSATTISRETIERRQATDLYDVIAESAGVAIDGGPRASGKSISIRGFTDNEDIITRIDGATQNFEKYRYGSSLELDPDLVRQVEVLRGAATITEGAGALGGIVLAETLRAADLLEPDQRFGARGRGGYTTNDDGKQGSLSAYGRPWRWLDLMASATARETNSFERPDGTRMPNSAESIWSGLLKSTLLSDYGAFEAIHRRGDAERLEPFDATGGAPGLFGNVRRHTTDASTVLRYKSDGGPDWWHAGLTLGHTDKELIDLPVDADGVETGIIDDSDYDIWTLDLRNDFAHQLGPVGGKLRVGVQGNREVRMVLRTNANGRQINDTQPPGEKIAWGAVLLETLKWGDFEANGGARLDRYDVQAKATSAQFLRAQGLEVEAGFSRLSPAAGLTWTPRQGPFSVFYSYSQAFRAPLVDEYFTMGMLSRCQSFSRYVQQPLPPTRPPSFTGVPPTPPGPPSSFPTFADFLAALDAFNAALARYQAALDAFIGAIDRFVIDLDTYINVTLPAHQRNPNAAQHAMCGADYEPELSFTHEVGAAYEWADLLSPGDALRTRLVHYRMRVEQLLESIYQDSVTGAVNQFGVEHRRGYELELDYAAERWFAQLALSLLEGETDLRYFDNNRNDLVARNSTAADRGPQPLHSVPADRLNVTMGHRWPLWNVELGYRLQAVDSRLVVTDTKPGCPTGIFVLPACNVIGTQSGYVLHGAFLRWRPNSHVTLGITGENLGNREYLLTGFAGGLGVIAPGRDVRMSIAVEY